MSVSAYALQTTGTALSWKASGGDYALTLTSLASAAARQGAKGDLGANWARRWAVLLATSMATGANGTLIELYWAPSLSATAANDNPGGCSGADAAFATPAEYKLQLIPIGSLAVSNNAGAAIQKQVFEFYPPTRYGMPVVVNGTAVALGATATDHEVRLSPDVEISATTITG
jgi:hypothetical protein